MTNLNRTGALTALCTLLIALTHTPVFTGAAAAEEPFEGIIRMRTKADGVESLTVYFVKPTAIRSETTGRGKTAVSIRDYANGKFYTLMSKLKQYLQRGLEDPANTPQEYYGFGQVGELPPENTGKTTKILGYDCDEWVIKSKVETTYVWIPKGFPLIKGLAHSWPGGTVMFFRRAIHNQKGIEIFLQEFTEIKREVLPDSLFSLPADYKKYEFKMKGSK